MTEHRESRIGGLNDLATQGNEGPVNDPTILVNKEKPLTPSVSSDTSSTDVEHDSALERLRHAFRGSIKEKAKIKFTVDMEEHEDEGRLGLRIDIWEANNQDTNRPSPSNNTTATMQLGGEQVLIDKRPIVSDKEDNTKETVDTNVPKYSENGKQAPKNREDTYELEGKQYDPNVAIINKTPPFNNTPEETIPMRDYGYREDFYHLT